MTRPPVLVLCDDPQLGDRINSAIAAAGGAPSAEPGGADIAVWTEGAQLRDDLGDYLAVVAVSELDLAGVVARLRDDRVSTVIHPAAIERALEPVVARLLGDRPTDLAGYLRGAELIELEIDDHAGRQRALDAVDQLAVDRRLRRSARDRIATTCDELMMNALYDAPIDGDGELVFGDVEPAARVAMKSPRPVLLRYGAIEDRLALGVTDRYGRLRRETVLNTLDKCMTAADPIDRKKLGSGLGLYMACNAASGLVIEIDPGATTEVIATFNSKPAPLELFGFFSAGGADA